MKGHESERELWEGTQEVLGRKAWAGNDVRTALTAMEKL